METYLIFLNLRLIAFSTTFARPIKQVLFLAIHTTTMESYLFIVFTCPRKQILLQYPIRQTFCHEMKHLSAKRSHLCYSGYQLSHLQYCAKVMQMIMDEYRALFSWFIADISAKHHADWQTLKWDIGTIFALSHQDIIVARFCCNNISQSKTINPRWLDMC